MGFVHYDMTESTTFCTTFQVKASSDAHILLSTQMKNTGGFVYEIVLGMQSNTDSGIRSVFREWEITKING